RARESSDPAVLRLVERKADRDRRRRAGGYRPRGARARGALGRGHPDDARAGARRAPLRRVPIGCVLDRLPWGDGSAPALASPRMSGETTRPQPAAKPVGRRRARRQALFLLYQWDLTGQPLASLYAGEQGAFHRAIAPAR